MAWMLPEVALQKVLQTGFYELRQHPETIKEIFAFYTFPEMEYDYGESYVCKIQEWFETTKIPVIQAWSFNAQRIPSVSIHLASEQEDETKAALGDYFGADEHNEVNINNFIVQLDIGVHADRSGDMVLWMYYIVSYILFKHKRLAESFGMKLQTWSATDWNKDPQYMTDNIWTRWLRFRCLVQNYWEGDKYLDIDHVRTGLDFEPA